MTIREILDLLKAGQLEPCYTHKELINNEAIKLLELPDDQFGINELEELADIIMIGNITYNNTSRSILPIEDGVYDMLVSKLQRIDYDRFTPGAIPIQFTDDTSDVVKQDLIYPIRIMSDKDRAYEENMLFPEIMNMRVPINRDSLLIRPFTIHNTDYISKRVRNVSHNYPHLVGTLIKDKFVLDKDAIDEGAFEDPNTTIFERDYIAPLIMKGLIHPNEIYTIIITIKYDGVSVEADVTDQIIGARTRGDTDNDEASDITPILAGYRFPNAPKLEVPIGMKFEAIITYDDLARLNEAKGTNYINGRTAIIGLMGSSDAWKYRDYITLVPLQADLTNIGGSFEERAEEIVFLNQYYATKEYLRYTIITGDYRSLMFQIHKFVEEATFARGWIPFMYDGIVVEFANRRIVELLGRKNSINQYARAIKFNPLKKQTVFRKFVYTVGQDGSITPMIYYDPIEFLGAIHYKSTGSSYARFCELDLRVGDIINVTYVNDVMPYVSKADVAANTQNHMRPISEVEKFPTHCPSCGSELVLSKSGKSMSCLNLKCRDRSVQRMANMMAKLGIKDFSESSIITLNVTHLVDLMQMNKEQLLVLGPTNAFKLRFALDNLIQVPLPDYRIIGALGFTGIAAKTWKLIFGKYSLVSILDTYKSNMDLLRDQIANIKGIGPITADTIITEMEFFLEDIQYIIIHRMYKETPIGNNSVQYQIRCTGFRDRKLEQVLNLHPFIDCDGDAGVTKNTAVLLVPHKGYNQGSKCTKATKYGVPIVDVKEFLESPGIYIPELSEPVSLE